jgi:predicted permease
VIGAILFTRNLQNLSNTECGFRRQGLILIDFNSAKGGFKGDRAILFVKVFLDRLNSTPAIFSAGCSFITPLSGRMWWAPVMVPGYTPAQNEMTTVYLNSVSPRYFASMGTTVLVGREFTEADDKTSRRVAIINESFARRFFHGLDAVGRKFTVGNGKDKDWANLEIVGVVANTKYRDPREKQKELVYAAMYQGGNEIGGAIQVRLAPGVSVNGASAEIRKIAAEIGKDVPVEIQPYDKLFGRLLQQDRMVALLSELFGFLGIVLACIGLYGVTAYSVRSRTGELGIRVALGAHRSSIVWMILRESLILAVMGTAIGVPVTLLSSRFIASYLFGLTSTDPLALVLAVIIILIVAILASYVPARRASKLDPVVALRA